MASSPEATLLTEAHRLAQARLGADTVRLMQSTWPLLDPTSLDATMARWLRVNLPIIDRQARRSADLASTYLRAFRAAEVGVSDWAPMLIELPSTEAVTTSLTVTGPVRIKKATEAGVPLRRAVSTAQAATAAAGMRHTLAGGRSLITRSIRADRRALGWVRTTSGDPCAFCAMLASRGAEYKTDSFNKSDPRFTGAGKFKVHDNCSCGLEPVYHRDTNLPAGTARYQELWKQAAAMDGNTTNNFRRLIETK